MGSPKVSLSTLMTLSAQVSYQDFLWLVLVLYIIDLFLDKGKPFNGCSGHQPCEEYCSGPIEDFLYYNNTKDTIDKVSPCTL